MRLRATAPLVVKRTYKGGHVEVGVRLRCNGYHHDSAKIDASTQLTTAQARSLAQLLVQFAGVMAQTQNCAHWVAALTAYLVLLCGFALVLLTLLSPQVRAASVGFVPVFVNPKFSGSHFALRCRETVFDEAGLCERIYIIDPPVNIYSLFAPGDGANVHLGPQAGGRHKKPESPSRYRPFGASTVALVLLLGLGSNGVMVAGLLSLNRCRRLGVILCIIACAMFIGSGFVLFPDSLNIAFVWPI